MARKLLEKILFGMAAAGLVTAIGCAGPRAYVKDGKVNVKYPVKTNVNYELDLSKRYCIFDPATNTLTCKEYREGKENKKSTETKNVEGTIEIGGKKYKLVPADVNPKKKRDMD